MKKHDDGVGVVVAVVVVVGGCGCGCGCSVQRGVSSIRSKYVSGRSIDSQLVRNFPIEAKLLWVQIGPFSDYKDR